MSRSRVRCVPIGIITPPPTPYAAPDAAIVEMKKFITLMLCCSVQCDNNERYINKIKDMDKTWQVELMTIIKEVAPCRAVCSVSAPPGHGCVCAHSLRGHGAGGV